MANRAGVADDDSLRIQHSARGDDDEPRDQASSYGAGDHIDLLCEQLVGLDALLNYVALVEEHHPGRNGGADHGYDQ